LAEAESELSSLRSRAIYARRLVLRKVATDAFVYVMSKGALGGVPIRNGKSVPAT
jgi:hypothetical protein